MMIYIKFYTKLILLLAVLVKINFLPAAGFQAAFNDDIIGAKAMSLGGAFTAVCDNTSSIIYNPAGLIQLGNNFNTIFEYSSQAEYFDYLFAGFFYNFSEKFKLGSAILHSGDDIYSETTFYLTPAFSLNHIKPNLRFLEIMDNIGIGCNFKIHYSSFGDNGSNYLDHWGINHLVSGKATGFSFDTGILFDLNSYNNIGITAKNLFSDIKWESSNEAGSAKGKYSESLPVTLTAGYQYKSRNFDWSVDLNKAFYKDKQDHLHTGLIYYVIDNLFNISSGYSQELVTNENQKFSLGLGFENKIYDDYKIRIQIAYQYRLAWEKHNNSFFSIEFIN